MTDEDRDALAEAYNRALALEQAGDIEGASAAFQEVLALDPQDHGGASIRLATMGQAAPPAKAPDAYVATLFDQNAETFDRMLVEDLGYSVPPRLREVLLAQAPGPYRRLLDLGCGTGLTGEALADVSNYRVGVDLSEGMLDIAEEKDVYDRLYVAEACAFLNETDEDAFDLIVATDVLPYIGQLKAFFDGLRYLCTASGVIAFSSETLPDKDFAGAPFKVGPHHRFAHTPDYLGRVMSEARFAPFAFDPIVVRYEQGTAVPGYLVLARRS